MLDIQNTRQDLVGIPAISEMDLAPIKDGLNVGPYRDWDRDAMAARKAAEEQQVLFFKTLQDALDFEEKMGIENTEARTYAVNHQNDTNELYEGIAMLAAVGLPTKLPHAVPTVRNYTEAELDPHKLAQEGYVIEKIAIDELNKRKPILNEFLRSAYEIYDKQHTTPKEHEAKYMGDVAITPEDLISAIAFAQTELPVLGQQSFLEGSDTKLVGDMIYDQNLTDEQRQKMMAANYASGAVQPILEVLEGLRRESEEVTLSQLHNRLVAVIPQKMNVPEGYIRTSAELREGMQQVVHTVLNGICELKGVENPYPREFDMPDTASLHGIKDNTARRLGEVQER